MIPLDPAILEFEYEWRQGSRERAMVVAIEFVNRYRNELTKTYASYTQDQLVQEVDELYKCGGSRHMDRLVTDMWLLSEFGPKQIIGEAAVIVDIMKILSQATRSSEDVRI